MTSSEQPQSTVWPALHYDDARAAIRFLVDVVGFREALVVPTEDGEDVQHAELRWPEGGAVMLGSTKMTAGTHGAMKAGMGVIYVVSQHVDEIHARVVASGAEISDPLKDTDYGSHGFTLRDAEGNIWTIGTYRGAP